MSGLEGINLGGSYGVLDQEGAEVVLSSPGACAVITLYGTYEGAVEVVGQTHSADPDYQGGRVNLPLGIWFHGGQPH